MAHDNGKGGYDRAPESEANDCARMAYVHDSLYECKNVSDFYGLLQKADMPPEYHSHLGSLLIKRGAPGDAEVAFRSFMDGIAAGDRDCFTLAASCYLAGVGTFRDEDRGLSLLETGASVGDVASACRLAQFYLEGEHVTRNVGKAISLYEAAANHSSGYAAWMLGTIYGYDGYGVRDAQKSISWHHTAISLFYYDSYLNLGLMYYSGKDLPRDCKKAFDYFSRGHNHGVAGCTYMMGFLMAAGDIPGGEEKGLPLIREAASKGDNSALVYMGSYHWRMEEYSEALDCWSRSGTEEPKILYNIAYACEYGLGTDVDYERAYGNYRAAADGGNQDAVYRLGSAFLGGELGLEADPDRGVVYIMRAANAGQADAEFSMGVFHAYGSFGFESDAQAAMEWYGKAAKKDHPQALFHTGLAYYINGMYAEDFIYGLNCIRKSYELGYEAAAVALGVCYTEGKACEKDYPKAADLFRAGAEAGSADGCYNLARFYEMGVGVEKDLEKAYGWYSKAYEISSDDTAAEAMKRLRPFVRGA